MSDWIKTTLPHLGLDFETKACKFFNRTGAPHVRGSIMQLDTFRTSPFTTSTQFGSSASCWVNLVDPDLQAAGTKGGQAFAIMVVLLQDLGVNGEGLAAIWGLDLLCRSTADPVVAGDLGQINVNLSNELEFMGGVTTLNSASKGIAIAQASSPGGVLVPCLFNGFHFWGKV